MVDFLSLGMGVQSSTLALKAAYGQLRQIGYDVKAAVFADTQGEPRSVYRWAERLKAYVASAPHPYPIYIVTQGNLTEESLRVIRSKKSGKLYQKNLIPLFILNQDGTKGIFKRKCTDEYKIRAVQRQEKLLLGKDVLNAWRRSNRAGLKAYRAALGAAKNARKALPSPIDDFGLQPLCRTLIGISTDEIQRMKPAREPWTKNAWPLIELGMSRSDCEREQIEMLGERAPRSACVYCPYHSDAEWLRLKTEEPEEFARAVSFDYAIREANTRDEVTRGVPYLHSSRKPLDLVNFNPEEYIEGQDQETECEGMCGV